MLFSRNKPDVSRTQALAAKPTRLVEAPVSLDASSGAGKLKVPLQPSRWGRFLFRVPGGLSKTFEFDEIGVMVWESCDGKTSVQQIIRRLAKRYHLNLREAEVATIRFLQMLTKRQLIGMSVPKAKDER